MFSILLCGIFLFACSCAPVPSESESGGAEVSSGSVELDEKNTVKEFTYPATGIDALDKKAKSVIDNCIQEYKKQVEEYGKQNDEFTSTFEIKTELTKAEHSASLSVITNFSSPMLSAEEKQVMSYTYGSDGKTMELTDFVPEKYLSCLTDYAEDYYKKDEAHASEVGTDTFTQGTAAGSENYKNFMVDNENLYFYFEPYQIFADSSIYKMTLSKADLNNYIEAAKKPVSSVTPVKPSGRRKIDPNKPMVALTFDDGPHYKYTPQILDALKKYNGAATFFMLGPRVPECQSVIKRMVEEGHQLGNHTYNHKSLVKLNLTDLTNEVEGTNRELQKVVGQTSHVVRPPYGACNDFVRQNVNCPLINWCIDTQDWKTKNTPSIIQEATKNVHDGDIILMHDIYATTANAVEEICRILTNKGYQLVTIDEMFEAKGITPVNGKVYYNIK